VLVFSHRMSVDTVGGVVCSSMMVAVGSLWSDWKSGMCGVRSEKGMLSFVGREGGPTRKWMCGFGGAMLVGGGGCVCCGFW